VAWLAEPGSTRPLTATLALRDPFGASFTWQIAGAPSWLGVSATSGSGLPADVTLTANPTGLATGVYSGSLTVSSPNGSFQSQAVTATLQVAEVKRVYLPFLGRSTP
jgi:hypothetical protein